MTSPTDTEVTVTLPASLAPRLYAAVRGTYGTITGGIADDAAATAAVVAHWLAQTLQGWEGQQATAPQADEAAKLQAKYAELQAKAIDKAAKDAAKIAAKAAK